MIRVIYGETWFLCTKPVRFFLRLFLCFFCCGGLGLGFGSRLGGLGRRLQRCTKRAGPQSLGGIGTLARVFAGIGFWHGGSLILQDRNSLLQTYHGEMRKTLKHGGKEEAEKGTAGITVIADIAHDRKSNFHHGDTEKNLEAEGRRDYS